MNLIFYSILLAIIQFLLGGFWYSFLFKKLFIKMMKPENMDNITSDMVRKAFIKQIISNLIKSICIMVIITIIPQDKIMILMISLPIFISMVIFDNNIWNQDKNLGLVYLDISYNIVSIILLLSLGFYLWNAF